MLPNGCSTLSRRRSSTLGRAARRAAMRSRTASFSRRHAPEAFGAAGLQRARLAGGSVDVVDLHVVARTAFVERREDRFARANEDILFGLVAELLLAEEALAHRLPADWLGHVGSDAGRF